MRPASCRSDIKTSSSRALGPLIREDSNFINAGQAHWYWLEPLLMFPLPFIYLILIYSCVIYEKTFGSTRAGLSCYRKLHYAMTLLFPQNTTRNIIHTPPH